MLPQFALSAPFVVFASRSWLQALPWRLSALAPQHDEEQQSESLLGRFSLDTIRTYPAITVESGKGAAGVGSSSRQLHRLFVQVYADRGVRVLRVTDTDPTLQLDRPTQLK